MLSFDAGAPAPKIEFEIHGIRSGGEAWVEEFLAVGDVPAGQVFEFEDLGARLQAQAGETVTPRARAAFLPFFEQALDAESYPRFVALLEDWRERPVGAALLLDVMKRLAAVMAERPTAPSSPSSGGRGITPATSAPASSSPPVLPPAASPTSASVI